ncbi:MAG: bile acid:sodium symporter family protein [Thermogutta sp.]
MSKSYIARAIRVVGRVLERGLVVWLVALCAVAFFWPSQPLATWGDPFVASQGRLRWWIAATMLAIGSLLPRSAWMEVVRRWPWVLFGTAVQYGTMPLLAYLVGRGLALDGPFLIGVLMVGCVPGAMASNVCTLLARGHVSYSVSLTTSATLLSPLVVPAAMWLTVGRVAPFPVVGTGVELLTTVVLPVAAGSLLAHVSTHWRRLAELLGGLVANTTILWIIAVVTAINRDRLEQVTLPLAAALPAINLGGYLSGWWAGRAVGLPNSMRRALTLEVGMQNAGLGTVLTLQLFPDMPQAAIPCACYTFLCMFTGTMLARYWSGREPSDASAA